MRRVPSFLSIFPVFHLTWRALNTKLSWFLSFIHHFISFAQHYQTHHDLPPNISTFDTTIIISKHQTSQTHSRQRFSFSIPYQGQSNCSCQILHWLITNIDLDCITSRSQQSAARSRFRNTYDIDNRDQPRLEYSADIEQLPVRKRLLSHGTVVEGGTGHPARSKLVRGTTTSENHLRLRSLRSRFEKS